jgi:hypothetical protein
MAMQLLDNVISPEAGVQKVAGGPPPMGGPPGRPPGGPGGRPPGGPPLSMGGPPSTLSSFAKRLDTLENKTLYLVDIGFGGGYNFMMQLQKWFAKNMPSVTTEVRRKPGGVFSDDRKELREDVKAKGQAVVLGVAG